MENKPTRAGFVSLIGAPNAGKSTIANHFAGSKVSIVSPKAQTTRTVVKAIGVFENTQIIFLDTPGIFNPKRRLDRAMLAAAWGGVKDADIVVLVVDAQKGLKADTEAIVQKLKDDNIKAVLLLNKTDLVKQEKLLVLSRQINEMYAFEQTFMVSALKGEHIEDFYHYLALNLPISPFLYPEEQMSDMPLKLLAAEVVREKMFLYLRDELPYSSTVEPELWQRRDDETIRAEITIYVARDNQKIIVLGKNGQMIKKIGMAARKDLEEMLGERIHLFLFVKVRENWENDPARYGLWGLPYNA